MIIHCLFSPAPRQLVQASLTLVPGSSVQDAIEAFKASAEFKPYLEAFTAAARPVQGQGIWSRRVALNELLKEGDRLEIYRSLLVDPKIARKQRFKGQGKGRTGLFARRRIGAVAGY